VFLKQILHQVLGGWRDGVPDLARVAHLTKENGLAVVIVRCKGQIARKHHVNDDAKRPEVDLLSVWPLENDLWSHVAFCANRFRGFLFRTENGRQAEINDAQAYAVLTLEEDVLRLEIAMHDAEGMKILQAEQYLVRELFCTALRDVEPAFLKIVEEVAAADQLGDNEESRLILVGLEKTHDARMQAEPVDLDLGPELLRGNALLADDLDGDVLTGLLVDCRAH
jgi:hypothetical protein